MILDSLQDTGLIVRLVIALLILILGLIFGRFIGNLVKKVLHELEINKIVKKQTKIKFSIEDLLGSIIKYLIYFIAIILALNQIGLTATILTIILVLLLTVILIFIILAVKDFIPNIVAGFFIHQKRNIKIGDTIKTGQVEGKITHINLVETQVQSKNKDIVFIPNSFLMKGTVQVKRLKKS